MLGVALDRALSLSPLTSMVTPANLMDSFPRINVVLVVVSFCKGKRIKFSHLELSPPRFWTRGALLHKFKPKF